ncbi:bacteriocin [Chryseobacterium sp. ERMR1:04]|uniref:bacteriocin n=1 Tax=Chryseobacterium sp. ERMR1:04 TaxID=1705393 RepID=UPI0006C8A8BF|nr:bacteriocin [Chryseobacterium sp. ERMR1:04]KPH14806.1 hypothetical protein AMQ68_05050 [Chryseobacterium sp. ERMR1:04]
MKNLKKSNKSETKNFKQLKDNQLKKIVGGGLTTVVSITSFEAFRIELEGKPIIGDYRPHDGGILQL